MPKLCTVIPVVKEKKKQAHNDITAAHQKRLTNEMTLGFAKKYHPGSEDGDVYPDEGKLVQSTVSEVVADVEKSLVDLFDVVYTQECGNTVAAADIVVKDASGNPLVLAAAVPVTYLLFIEKRLVDIETFVSNLPTLAGATRWTWSDGINCYVSDTTRVNKTKKVMKSFEASPATDRHPAQVQVFNEDVIIGYYDVEAYSGAIQAKVKADMLARVRALKDAVVTAREEANSKDVEAKKIGSKILGYIFGTK